MAFIFDIIIVGIIVLCTVACRRKGLVRSLIELTGGMVSAFFAYLLAKPCGAWLSEHLVSGLFAEKAASELISIEGTKVTGSAVEAIESIDIGQVIKDAPTALTDLLDSFNIDLAQIQSISDSKVTVSERANAVVESIVSPIAANVSTAVCFVLLFIAFMVVISLLAKAASGISYIPVVGKANRALGTVFGVLKGAVFVLIFTAALNVVMPYLSNPMGLDKTDPYSETVLTKYVCDINPLIKLIPDSFEK